MQVVAFPSSHDLSALLSSHHQALFISTADTATGVVNGYQIMFDQLLPFSTNQIWSLNFPLDSEKLITVASKSPNGTQTLEHSVSHVICHVTCHFIEHVSSQGRVRTDRSVQFKYLNPNLVAMVTEAIEYSKRKYFEISDNMCYEHTTIQCSIHQCVPGGQGDWRRGPPHHTQAGSWSSSHCPL